MHANSPTMSANAQDTEPHPAFDTADTWKPVLNDTFEAWQGNDFCARRNFAKHGELAPAIALFLATDTSDGVRQSLRMLIDSAGRAEAEEFSLGFCLAYHFERVGEQPPEWLRRALTQAERDALQAVRDAVEAFDRAWEALHRFGLTGRSLPWMSALAEQTAPLRDLTHAMASEVDPASVAPKPVLKIEGPTREDIKKMFDESRPGLRDPRVQARRGAKKRK